jgi:hypothetical protein
MAPCMIITKCRDSNIWTKDKHQPGNDKYPLPPYLSYSSFTCFARALTSKLHLFHQAGGLVCQKDQDLEYIFIRACFDGEALSVFIRTFASSRPPPASPTSTQSRNKNMPTSGGNNRTHSTSGIPSSDEAGLLAAETQTKPRFFLKYRTNGRS